MQSLERQGSSKELILNGLIGPRKSCNSFAPTVGSLFLASGQSQGTVL